MLKLGKKLNLSTIFWILFYFLLFSFLLKNSFGYLDPDLGWHLKVGEYIAHIGSVPHANLYNYTYTGNWVDHEWLANLLSFEIYDHFGYVALNIFFALLIIVSFIILNILARKVFPKAPRGSIVFLQLFGLIACLPHFGVRMQEFGFLFVILELAIIERFSRKYDWRALIWLPPLFYLWASLHGSFLLGLGLLAAWLAIRLFEKSIKIPAIKIFLIFSVFSLMATTLTPYRLELYSFLAGYRDTFYLSSIQEWLPQFVFPFNYWQMAYLAMIVFVFGLYIFRVVRRKGEKIDLWQLFLMVFFLILGFRSRRHFPLLFIATFFFLIGEMIIIFELDGARKLWLAKKLKYLLLICLGLAVSWQLLTINPVVDPFRSFCKNFPCAAADFLKQENKYQGLNLLNDYNWGGYLIWSYPERKLFIDGRLPQVGFAGHSFLAEYGEFYDKDTDYAAKLKQYDIGLVLIKTQDIKIEARDWEKFIFWLKEDSLVTPNYLRYYLEGSSEWKKIYFGPLASIYLRIK